MVRADEVELRRKGCPSPADLERWQSGLSRRSANAEPDEGRGFESLPLRLSRGCSSVVERLVEAQEVQVRFLPVTCGKQESGRKKQGGES